MQFFFLLKKGAGKWWLQKR